MPSSALLAFHTAFVSLRASWSRATRERLPAHPHPWRRMEWSRSSPQPFKASEGRHAPWPISDIGPQMACPPSGRRDQHHVRQFPAVRVVHVVESGDTARHVGRMRISGRMADVCAELDRMVEREALQCRAGR